MSFCVSDVHLVSLAFFRSHTDAVEDVAIPSRTCSHIDQAEPLCLAVVDNAVFGSAFLFGDTNGLVSLCIHILHTAYYLTSTTVLIHGV